MIMIVVLKINRMLSLAWTLAAFSVISCRSLPIEPQIAPVPPENPAALPSTAPAAVPVIKPADELYQKIIATGESLIGTKYGALGVIVNGKSFTIDCIGLVSAAYWGAGIDITVDFKKFEGNGVSRLYQSLESRRALRSGKTPEVGDVVFWDNTWDRNENGKFGDDPLTHAGIIMKVESDGTIYYLHAAVGIGVSIDRMNLLRPTVLRDEAGKRINSMLYLNSKVGSPNNPPRFLSGDLFKAFGNVEKAVGSFR